MGKYLKISFLIILLSFLSLVSACAPAMFVPRQMPELKFEKTSQYQIDLSKIPKPEMLKPVFMDENFKETSSDKAVYIVLVPSEYAKIAALTKLCKTYKDIVKEQEILVNSNINIINSLKEFVELERLKAEEYQNLYADSENAFRREQYYHRMDNAINKGSFSLLSLGVIALLIML